MNRVRRTSRKYAEIMNRPDHIARTRKEGERRAAMKQRIANEELLRRDEDRRRSEIENAKTPFAKESAQRGLRGWMQKRRDRRHQSR
jgi:hypothetical protein